MLNEFRLNENINNQRGQATVEYLFLAVLTLAVMAVVSAQVYKPLGSFVENYMGSYLQCLLDVGELPKLGSNNQSSVSVCEEEYKPFSLASGRAPKNPSRANNSSSDSENSSKNKSSRNSSSLSSNNSSSGSSLAGNRRTNTGSSQSSGADGKAGQESEASASSESKFMRTRGFGSYQNSSASGRTTTVESGFEGFAAYQKTQRKKLQNRSRKIASLPEEESRGNGPRTTIVKPVPNISTSTDTGINWSFGKILKFCIIILIIIVILFFVFNQLNQISKSLEKS
jgi:hypothetical protein